VGLSLKMFGFFRLFGLGHGRRVVMDNGINLKKQGVVLRMVHHPVGALMGGLVSAVVCGYLGSIHGEVAGVAMAALGAIVGALLGAMLAASSTSNS
jgi:hypothetical protein